MRKLITVEQLIDDLKAEGIEADEAFIDADDVVQIADAEDEEN